MEGDYNCLIYCINKCSAEIYLFYYRVNKMLNVARAFGDAFLKKYVTAEPYCPDPVLVESSVHCPFFILACDGKVDSRNILQCLIIFDIAQDCGMW